MNVKINSVTRALTLRLADISAFTVADTCFAGVRKTLNGTFERRTLSYICQATSYTYLEEIKKNMENCTRNRKFPRQVTKLGA